MRDRVRRHDLTVYLLATFAVSWAFWIPSAVLFVGGAGEELVTTPLFVGLQTMGAVGPTVVALAMTRWLRGRSAVTGLLRRFRPGRQLTRWYLAAALTVPILTLVAMSIRSVVSAEPFVDPASGLAEMAGETGWIAAVALLPLVLVSQLFSSPLLEEAGWRGYALPRLQARAGALLSGVILGIVWGLWHLPLVIAYGDPFAPYLAGIVANSVLLTWMFNGAGGNLSVMLVGHASMNLSFNILLPLAAGWIPAVVSWMAVALIVRRFGASNLAGGERYAEHPLRPAPTAV